MSDYYQLTNSNSDFKSRSSDVFDKLTNLEEKHDAHVQANTPLALLEDDVLSSASSIQNPNIPNHAITFKKRPAEDTYTRPKDKWKKYDLGDVNEHHLSSMGNQYAFTSYLRTRAQASVTEEAEEETPSKPIFQRPLKKQVLPSEDDDNNDNHFITIKGPLPSDTVEAKTNDDDDEEEKTIKYRLKSIRKRIRGVVSKNEKASTKSSTELLQNKDHDDDQGTGSSDEEVDYQENEDVDDNDDDNEDIDGDFFEP